MNYKTVPGKFFENVINWPGRWSQDFPNSQSLLRLYSKGGQIIGLVQYLPKSGSSLTNNIERVATLVFKMCKDDFGLRSPNDFQWIEYYAKEHWLEWKDRYALVHLDWNGDYFSNPEWESKSFEEIKEIIGEDPPKSKLKDRPYEFTDLERKGLFESLSRALKWNPILAKYGGYLEVEASKYTLFRQDREGQFVFGHPDAESIVLLTSDEKIKFPDEEYSRRNH